MAISACPRLSEISDGDRVTVRSLSSPTSDIGRVSNSAVFDEDAHLRHLLSSLDTDNYFLLHTYEWNYCAYRMDIDKGTNFERAFKKDIGRDTYGVKTNFVLNGYIGDPLGLVILDNGMVLSRNDIDDDNSWYSVGNDLAMHLNSILGYYDIIERSIWQNALLYFIPELSKSILDMADVTWLPDIESDESMVEIATFMDWLSQYDPALHDGVAFYINQNTEDHGDMTFCEMNFLKDAYAYAKEGEFTILPAGISELKNDEYEFMALVLEHELSHIMVSESGLIRPSEQLFNKGLLLYMVENRLINVPGLVEYLARHVPCQLQPLIFEDEIVATLAEISSPNAVFSFDLAESYALLDYLESQIYNPDIYPPEMLDIHHQFVKNALKVLDMQKNP